MKKAQRQEASAILGLLILFSLLYVQLAADPCPLHDRPAAHARTPGVSCKAMMCLCLPGAFFPPAQAWLVERYSESAPLREFSGGRTGRFFFLEVDHPPRTASLS
jgi:hypothetical protein